jgi:uroporphyrinogen-III decarboxylase
MTNINYAKHNEKVKTLLEDEKRCANKRILMRISCNPRMILTDPFLNTEGVEFKTYMENPETMLEIQYRFQEYCANELVWDKIMGFDNIPGLTLYADAQNVLEANWFGCPVAWHGTAEPGTKICLDDSNKYAFLKKPFPELHQGVMGNVIDITAHFEDFKNKGYEYKGKPVVQVNKIGLFTDGPFTIGCCLLGATELCLALYEEPEFARDFLTYLTDATIDRIKRLKRFWGLNEKTENLGFADDSIALLSPETYAEFLLPLHKKLINELTTKGDNNSIHLCGNATHHFPMLVKELNVRAFDTGFPVRFGELIKKLGPDVAISGGVHVDILLNGGPDAIKAETKRILEEVKPLTRRFTIKEANNLSPGTKPESLLAMYQTVEEYGLYVYD